ncbi:signal peptidase I [candidate division WWE3 bacterium]|nr:signal peptidase I [candidate division WWE3 bacterium]
MYPTLYWDKKEGGLEDYETAIKENEFRVKPKLYPHILFEYDKYRLEKPKLNFGDIVSFTKKGSQDSSYIKRVIGTPGDRIELKDGYVIRNGVKLHEPYINKPRSTFGGSFIEECAEVAVPVGKYIVLGDNRKLSLDSRFELGLIAEQEIDFTLPFGNQNELKGRWRQIANDEFEDNKVTLDITAFLNSVNKLRGEFGQKPLSLNQNLIRSSSSRASFILKNNNFESKNGSGANYFGEEMTKAGYDNALTGEFVIRGYYDHEELLSLRIESKEFSSMLLEKRYQDIGVSVENKNVNNCPTQVIVLHFGGYIPATYDQATIKNWQDAVDKSVTSARNWKEARDIDYYDQQKLEDMLKKYETTTEISKYIYNKIENRLWLTESDKALIDQYDKLIDGINKIAKELNAGARKESDRAKRQNYETCLDNWKLYVDKKEDCEKYLN